MAGPKNNTIEYILEGNTLGLEAAIKKVVNLLATSTKRLKEYQDGALTSAQMAQAKSLKGLLKVMQAGLEAGNSLSDDQRKQVIAAGKEAVRIVSRLSKESYRVKDRARQQEAKAQAKAGAEALKEQQKQADLEAKIEEENLRFTSVAGQENATQHANYLEKLNRELEGFLSEGARREITNAVLDFRQAQADFAAGKINQDQLAEATRQLQQTYKDYNETLRSTRQGFQSANKGVTSFKNLIGQTKEYISMMTKSMVFWVQVLRKVIQAIKDGIKASADYVESINFLNVALGGANKEFSDFIKLQRLALGLDPTQLNETAAIFYSFGNAIGLASDETVIFSQNLTKLATDLSSLYNTDLETMTTALRSGLAGNTRPLMRFGISVHDATIEQWLLTQGIKANMSAMSEASQAAARYAYIMAQTSNAQGDLARTLKSPANQMRILQTQLKLVTQNFGSVALVIVGPLMRALNIILQPINALLLALTSLSTAGITGAIGEQEDALDDMADSAERAGSNLTGLDEINQQSSSGGMSLGIDPTLQSLIEGYDNMANAAAPLIDIFDRIGLALAPVFKLLDAPFDIIINAFSLLADTLALVLTPLEPILQGFSWLVTSIMNPLISFVAALTDNIWLLIGAFAILNLAQLAYTGSITSMMAVKAILWFKTMAAAIWSNVSALVANIAKTIAYKAASLAMTAVLWWETAAWWQKAIAVIAAAGAGALIIAGIVAAATANTKSQAQQATSNVGAPALATGGVVTGPTLALVGEGRYNEAVVPLGNSPQFTSMKESIASEVVGGLLSAGLVGSRPSQGSSQNIILQMDGRELARALWPKLASTYNQAGVKLT